MNGMVLILGVPGVGKTTIGRAVAKRVNYQFIDTADLIIEAVQRMGIPINRHDEIPDLPQEVFVEALKAIRRDLSKMSENQKIILDTYITPKIRGLGYWFIPTRALRQRNPKGIIVITADPLDILMRRASDEGRSRQAGVVFEVGIDQFVIITAAIKSCMALDIPCKIIYNRPGRITEAIEEATTFIMAMEKFYKKELGKG